MVKRVYFLKNLLIDLREKGERGGGGGEQMGEGEKFVVPIIYAFIGCWFLYVPRPEIESATLVYGNDVLSVEPPGQGKEFK